MNNPNNELVGEKIYCVAICDCENNSTIAIFRTKESALKRLFEERDRLCGEWRKSIDHESRAEMYSDMIKNLSGYDHENWDNYPHEKPYIYETELLP